MQTRHDPSAVWPILGLILALPLACGVYLILHQLLTSGERIASSLLVLLVLYGLLSWLSPLFLLSRLALHYLPDQISQAEIVEVMKAGHKRAKARFMLSSGASSADFAVTAALGTPSKLWNTPVIIAGGAQVEPGSFEHVKGLLTRQEIEKALRAHFPRWKIAKLVYLIGTRTIDLPDPAISNHDLLQEKSQQDQESATSSASPEV